MAVIAGWLALAAGCAAGWALRFLLIEPEAMQSLCVAAGAPAWCAARTWALVLTFPPRYGMVAVAAAIACWFLRGRPAALVAVLALLCGGMGLFLYDTGWSASAALMALLRMPRIGEEPPDPREFSA